MRAIVVDESGVRLVPDRADPRPPGRESLVRVVLAGICETDLQPARGYMNFQGVLGHEFVGVVETGPWRSRLSGREEPS